MKLDHFKLYVLAEMNYIKQNQNLTKSELFPLGWYNIKDYFFKTKVLAEAIRKNILIKYTELYSENIITTKSR